MKIKGLLSIKLVALLLAGQFLLGCQKDDQKKTPGEPVASPMGAPHSGADGTTDGAGGNGINNKIYESYIVNPQKLKAYELHLSKQMEILNNAVEPDSAKRGNLSFTGYLTHWKTWYVAPIELKTVSKNALGVSFSKDKTQQFAIQTRKEVWIDSHLFDQMKEEDQADLILHELVMNLYLVKFVKLSEICKLNVELNEKGCETSGIDNPDEFLPAEQERPLNDDDYAKIRRVTNWIASLDAPISQKELYNKLAANDFDKRFFKEGINDSNSTVTEKISIDDKMTGKLLKKSETLGYFRSNCEYYDSTVPCEVLVEIIQPPKEGWQALKAKVSIIDRNTQQELESHVYLLNSSSAVMIQKAVDGKKFAFLYLMELTKAVVGQNFKNLVLIVDFDESFSNGPDIQRMTVRKMIFVPGRITSAEPDNSIFQKCEASTPVTQGKESSVVFMGIKSSETGNYYVANPSNVFRSSIVTCQ
jgi:hypothetical protein